MLKKEHVHMILNGNNPQTINQLMDMSISLYRCKQAVHIYNGKEEIKISFGDFYQKISQIQNTFRTIKNAHIVFMCDFSYEFICLFLGVICSGNIAIPINPNLSTQELCDVLRLSNATHIIFDKKFVSIVQILTNQVPIQNTLEIMEIFSDNNNDLDNIFQNTVDSDSVAVMFLTSGTTGDRKLVMLTHNNLVSNVISVCKHLNLYGSDSIIPILPNYHILGITTGIFLSLVVGGKICISRGLGHFIDDLMFYKPTTMVIVPMIAKSIYQRICNEITYNNNAKKLLKILLVSNKFMKCKIDLRKLFFKKIHNLFGGKLRMIVCGGASINADIAQFFNDIGIDFLCAYGLTECSPVVSLNRPYHNRCDSCGHVIPDVEVSIHNDMIYVRGANVFIGYYQNDLATKNAFVNGWFQTGDLGYFDDQQYLHIIGRSDEVIILSNGENINPILLENYFLTFTSSIDELFIFKDNIYNDMLATIITPKTTIKNLNRNKIIDILRAEISQVNKTLPIFQRIQKIYISTDSCNINKTELGKIKRKQLYNMCEEGVLI